MFFFCEKHTFIFGTLLTHYRQQMVDRSPMSFSANAAICHHDAKVHFARAEYIGGIIEFMGQGIISMIVLIFHIYYLVIRTV